MVCFQIGVFASELYSVKTYTSVTIGAAVGPSTDQEMKGNIEVLPALLFIILKVKSSSLNVGFVTL